MKGQLKSSEIIELVDALDELKLNIYPGFSFQDRLG
jgi:hypothetical protein